jgi:signal transduction histidine kinase/CHASE3 domain sensor protein
MLVDSPGPDGSLARPPKVETVASPGRWHISSTETRIVAAVCGTLLLLFLAGGWAYQSAARSDASMAEAARIQEIRATLSQLYAKFSDAESAQRHYLLTTDDEQRDRYRQLIAQVAIQRSRLSTLMANDVEQRSTLAQLEASVARCFAILDLETKRFEEGTFTTRAQLITAGLSDPARTMTRSIIEHMDAREAAAQGRLEAQAKRIRHYTLAALLLGLGGVTVLGALLVRGLRVDMRVREKAGRLDAWSQRAMALFASTLSEKRAIRGTLELLGEVHGDGKGGVAFYALAQDNGELVRTDAAGNTDALPMRAAPPHATGEGALQPCLGAHAAMLGAGASRDAGACARADGDAESHLLACPVVYLGRAVGVLALATPRALCRDECAFAHRIAAKLGVTLHNLRQYGDLLQLSAELTGKNEALRRQAAELEKGSQTKSEFLASMSHELRTPLNAIIGFAEALHENLVGDLTEEQREYIGDILGSGEHLLELINDILDLSKVEAGKMVLRLEPEDVRPILDSALTMVRERAHSNRVQVTVEVDNDLPMLWLDSRRLKQILFNLLGNAVKFTPEGGRVRLTARCMRSDAEATLHIAVSDTGIGISQADQARLFQPFVQIDSSLGKKFEGTGLGLAMVKRLAALHGGTVSVHSAPGEGSTFSVSLPCRVAKSDDMYEAAPVLPMPQARQRQLLMPAAG